MANYLQLKQQFNSNKKFIKQVLNDQKCQLRLQAEGLSTLNNLIKLLKKSLHFQSMTTVNIPISSLIIKIK